MKAEPLEFPRGIRFTRDDEVPADALELHKRSALARITTGYIRSASTKPDFTDFFEANVHASKVWEAFESLVIAIVPPVAAPIVGTKDEDPILGPYTSRQAALEVLEPFRDLLQHDGFLEFGIIFQHKGRTEEVFVRDVKYLQIWTSTPQIVIDVLAGYGIPEVIGLQFIDDYPRVTEALPFEGQASGFHVVIESLRDRFDSLPEPPDFLGA